ncbi:MAG: hypothetical protein ACREV6_22860 [Clostridium sp.]|uniref:hypothetical protein n=1 Tax=Clostridium sp. TaxID=1506 RepID=UPI003D6C977A
MENKESFVSDEKYNYLSDGVKLNLWELDTKLCSLNYCYNGVWRNDKENGGNIFVFELLENARKRKNVKNLITLRPQINHLKVEVYWGEKDKHFYDEIEDDVFQDITERFGKIGIAVR